LQHDTRLVAAQLGDRRRAIRRRNDLVVLEAPAELALNAGIVLDDQQLAGGGVRHGADAAINCREGVEPASQTEHRATNPAGTSRSFPGLSPSPGPRRRPKRDRPRTRSAAP